jgi:hypothetical protein
MVLHQSNPDKKIIGLCLAYWATCLVILSCAPIQGDTLEDLSGQGEAYQTALYQAITPVGNMDVVILNGQIIDMDPSCRTEEQSCQITIINDGVYVDLLYQCPTGTPVLDFQDFSKGDQIEVRGKHIHLGVIDLCGSNEYYIRPIDE